jgi:hypothetical protein
MLLVFFRKVPTGWPNGLNPMMVFASQQKGVSIHANNAGAFGQAWFQWVMR